MRPARKFGLALTTLAFAGSGLPAPSTGDPVTEARTQRAASLGIPEGDLPPVPKGIIEPPPLPPPEIHPKDARGGRRAVTRKASTRGKGAKGKAAPKAKAGTKARKKK
jgi:hypothetical protein